MATIAGVSVGAFGLPENDSRQQNVSLGKATDGTFQFYKFRSSDRILRIPLYNKTTSVKDSLLTALEADANYQVTIAPDSHVNLGGGAGTSITAQWIAPYYEATKVNHDSWNLTLYFQKV